MMMGLGIKNIVSESNDAEEGYYIKSSEGESTSLLLMSAFSRLTLST